MRYTPADMDIQKELKEKQREEIAAQIELFLANGGTIQILPWGASGIEKPNKILRI